MQLPAIVKGSSSKEKRIRNLSLIEAQLAAAGKDSSDIVLFGEYANLWHRGTSELKKDYVPEPLEGPSARLASAYARRYGMNVVFPMLTIVDGVPGSTCIIFDRSGTAIGAYRKSHPTIAEQKFGMKPGEKLPVFKLDCAAIGIMICMDIEYPEVAQSLMVKGAELLLFPHVQAGWGDIDWEIRMRARAIDTGLVLVSACYGYEEGEWTPGKMIGRSGIVDRDGTITADLCRRIGSLTTDVDLRQKRVTPFFFEKKYDRTLAVRASRRPELYGALISTAERDAALKLIRHKAKD